MKDILGGAIAKIKKQHIKPEPRWKYLAKKYYIWLVFLTAAFLGAVSFSVAVDMMSGLDWDLYRFAHQGAIAYSLSLLPYFWIVLISVFLTLSFFDLRKTETGYRYSRLKMFSASIAGVLIAGFVFALIGLGGRFNLMFSDNVPSYGRHMMMNKQTQWMQPEKGFLSGKIDADSADNLKITDLDGKEWNVLLNEKTLVRPAVSINKGEMIKIIGIQKKASTFEAFEIRPWMGQGMMNGFGAGRESGMMNRSSRIVR